MIIISKSKISKLKVQIEAYEINIFELNHIMAQGGFVDAESVKFIILKNCFRTAFRMKWNNN